MRDSRSLWKSARELDRSLAKLKRAERAQRSDLRLCSDSERYLHEISRVPPLAGVCDAPRSQPLSRGACRAPYLESRAPGISPCR